jgi:hypothetical protein
MGVYSFLTISLLLFLYRGPYRAIQRVVSGDFATVYAATRCWMAGTNPYDHTQVMKEFIAAGGPKELIPHSDFRPSVYFVTAMPSVAPVAWLPWRPANIVWAVLSVTSFSFLFVLIYSATQLSRKEKVLLASGMLAFQPTSTGVAMGNPSVIATNLIALAIYCAVRRQHVLAGLCAGLSLCIKPQLGMSAICVFVVWKHLLPIVVSMIMFTSFAAVGSLRAGSWDELMIWWRAFQHNIERSVAAGGINDPGLLNPFSFHLLNTQTLVGVFVRDAHWNNFVVYAIAAGLLAIYLWRRRQHAGSAVKWNDIAFFSVWTLIPSYHRYYDAQLLLLGVPVLLVWWKIERRVLAPAIGCACLALLMLPLQSAIAVLLGTGNIDELLLRLVLFRHAPLAVLMMAFILAIGTRPAMAFAGNTDHLIQL